MQELRGLCESKGFANVETYVQSGNLIFDSPERDPLSVAKSIHQVVLDRYGFDVPIIVRTKERFQKIIGANPLLGKDGVDESKLAVVFLSEKPTAAGAKNLGTVDPGPDRFHIDGRHIYLYCPSGFARTKLTNNLFEKRLGVKATARNWRTVNALFDMLGQR